MSRRQKRALIGCTRTARILGISSERVRQLHRAGRLPAAHIALDGSRNFDPKVVERFHKARARSKS